MKAMIFAAGLGTRFKPWTDAHPKALAMVNGKTLLQRNIEYLQQFNIYEVIINVHHFADQIINAVKTNNGWGSNVLISDERNELLETGGGLLNAQKHFTINEPFVLCNVDILTNLNINSLLLFHQQNKPLISFGVTNRVSSRNFLFDNTNRLCGWENKNTNEKKIAINHSPLIAKAYSCVAVLDNQIFNRIIENGFSGKFSLTDVYLKLASNHTILGFDHSGDKFLDVGKPESIAIAEKLFS